MSADILKLLRCIQSVGIRLVNSFKTVLVFLCIPASPSIGRQNAFFLNIWIKAVLGECPFAFSSLTLSRQNHCQSLMQRKSLWWKLKHFHSGTSPTRLTYLPLGACHFFWDTDVSHFWFALIGKDHSHSFHHRQTSFTVY